MAGHEALWRSIVDSEDQAAAVRAHLSFLTSTEECGKLLDRLMGQFVRADIDGERLTLLFTHAEFDDECLVECEAPYVGDADVPASYLAACHVHNGMALESIGGGWYAYGGCVDGRFANGGAWEWQALEEAGDDNAEFLTGLREAGLRPRDVLSPCDFGQNWLIWNPAERNSLGEPTVYFVSHGDCAAVPVDEVRDLGFGALYLRVLVQAIVGDDVLAAVYS